MGDDIRTHEGDPGDIDALQDDLEGTAEEKVEQAYLEELREKEPSSEEKASLRAEHEGHLVRDTTSQITESDELDGGGIKMQKTVEVPDTYCFTCGEWVGLSGAELSGTPRSRATAYYLGGKPPEIRTAEEGVSKTLDELAEALVERVGHVEDRGAAYEFIETKLEAMQNDE